MAKGLKNNTLNGAARHKKTPAKGRATARWQPFLPTKGRGSFKQPRQGQQLQQKPAT